jgi:proline iminopeptidase
MKDRMVSLASRGIALFVRIVGEGHPVLLMHGGPGADHSTLLSLSPLYNRFKLIFYDHRCNGRSLGADIKTMTWENLTADVEALRSALGINKWAVVGHSFGGMVALEYAIRFPQALSHLCVLDSCGDGHVALENVSKILKQRGFGRLSIETAERFFRGEIRQNQLVRSMMILGRAYYSKPSLGLIVNETFHSMRIRRNPIAFIHGFKELIPNWSVMSKIKDIQVPTLVLAGKDDFQFPPEHQKVLAESIGGSKLKIVEGAGHNAHIEKQKEVISILEDFLKN